MLRRYTVSLYYGVLNIGQNDYMPKNNIEYLFLVASLLGSAILSALIFGDIATLVLVISKEETRIQNINDATNSVMTDIELDEFTQ